MVLELVVRPSGFKGAIKITDINLISTAMTDEVFDALAEIELNSTQMVATMPASFGNDTGPRVIKCLWANEQARIRKSKGSRSDMVDEKFNVKKNVISLGNFDFSFEEAKCSEIIDGRVCYELISAVEDAYSLDINPSDARELRTIDTIVDYVIANVK